MTTGTDEKKIDHMAKARAAQAAKREAQKAAPPVQDDRFNQLLSAINNIGTKVEAQNARIDALAKKAEEPVVATRMATTNTPEVNIKEALKKIQDVGDEAAFVKPQRLDKGRNAFASRDLVQFVPRDEAGAKKAQAWRKAIGKDEEYPLVGQILQFLGGSHAKYRVEFEKGIGKDGCAEHELQLYQRAG